MSDRMKRPGVFGEETETPRRAPKTPGVYIDEINAFPNSVVGVPTAVPAFVGYTETARRDAADLTGVPTRISSMAEFEALFGGPPVTRFEFSGGLDNPALAADPATRFLLHHSMRLFYANGGGDAWIVSVGGYGDAESPTKKQGADFTGAALAALAKEAEPTMLVAPDAVLLPIGEWRDVMNAHLAQCAAMGDRIAIIDVYDGARARTHDEHDVISGAKAGLRTLIAAEKPSYGAAYYPWVNASVVEAAEIDFLNLDENSRSALSDAVAAELKARAPEEDEAKFKARWAEVIGRLAISDADAAKLAETPDGAAAIREAHAALASVSAGYVRVMRKLWEEINLLPPAAGIAGVYARTDATAGVFKAPANTGIAAVRSPAVEIDHDTQEDLNVPLDGKAVNAIRSFIGRGVLVWGARTLDGNSQDWRYLNVRRTLIFLEQSIRLAAEAYVFSPNDAATWTTVRNMIANFLNNQWKDGALAGAAPEDAYQVDVGLGSTMTPADILDGYMRVSVRVAVVRPAEFISIDFQQKMQTS